MNQQTKVVKVKFSDLQRLLLEGKTWFKKDDIGYGSIQEIYSLNDNDAKLALKHPAINKLVFPETLFVIEEEVEEEKQLNSNTSGKSKSAESSAKLTDKSNKESKEFNGTGFDESSYSTESSFESFKGL